MGRNILLVSLLIKCPWQGIVRTITPSIYTNVAFSLNQTTHIETNTSYSGKTQNQKMNCLSFCVLLAVAIVHVNAGGYVLKGGVVDFGKPLDYFDQAVQAGESFGVDFIKIGCY